MLAVQTTKRKRGRPSGVDSSLPSNTELMEIALAVFAKQGFEGTSMRAMARALGVSHNFLSSRYGSKENFWRRVVAHGCNALNQNIMKQQQAIAASGLPVQDQLRAVFRMHLIGLPMMTQIQQILSSEGPAKGVRVDFILEHFPNNVGFLEDLLERGKKEGVFKDTPVPVTAFLLLLMQNAQSILSLKPLAPYVLNRQAPSDDSLIESTIEVVMAGILRPTKKI